MSEKRLLGGSGGIKGKHRCVCFSEAPISKLAFILAMGSASGMRYKPFGVMVKKTWLFANGGHPVIYQPEADYDLLHEKQKFLHATYEPIGDKTIDYSWEREWRIQIDELSLDPEYATIIVPNRKWEKYIMERYSVKHMGFETWISDTIPLIELQQRPVWHLIALEDLGVPVLSTDPPNRIK